MSMREDDGDQSVQLMDYEKDKLDRVTIQYLPNGTSTWQTLRILQPVDLSDLPGGSKVSVNMGDLPDGEYQLRAKLDCEQGFVYSASIPGRIDRTAPQVFGEPEPSDDIYNRGKELSVTFDETDQLPVYQFPKYTVDQSFRRYHNSNFCRMF